MIILINKLFSPAHERAIKIFTLLDNLRGHLFRERTFITTKNLESFFDLLV